MDKIVHLIVNINQNFYHNTLIMFVKLISQQLTYSKVYFVINIFAIFES